jgi:hypothetical protein
VTRERHGPGGPRGIKVGGECVFVLEPPQALSRRLFRGESHRKERKGIAVLPATVKGGLRAFAQSLQHISGTHCHGAALAALRRTSHHAPNPIATSVLLLFHARTDKFRMRAMEFADPCSHVEYAVSVGLECD